MDVCAGGSISVGATSITFTNHHTVACKITSCELPGFPPIPPDVVVPRKLVHSRARRRCHLILRPRSRAITSTPPIAVIKGDKSSNQSSVGLNSTSFL